MDYVRIDKPIETNPRLAYLGALFITSPAIGLCIYKWFFALHWHPVFIIGAILLFLVTCGYLVRCMYKYLPRYVTIVFFALWMVIYGVTFATWLELDLIWTGTIIVLGAGLGILLGRESYDLQSWHS